MITSHQISVLNGLKLFAVVIFLNSAYILNGQKVIYTSEGSVTEIQAAKELRRYIFLRTGTAPDLVTADSYSNLPDGDVIVVSEDSRDIITALKQEYGNVDAPDSDNRKGYLIKSVDKGDGRDILVITGADSITTLNAAYRFAELLGCYFNLAGDVIPDKRLMYPLDIRSYDEKSQPWFELRGNLPFHNFLAGPDFWSTADYRSFLTQQAKMGLNFFGLHHYPERGEPFSLEGPEPHVWIGHKEDVNADGTGWYTDLGAPVSDRVDLLTAVAHEIGHVQHRHGLQAIKKSRVTAALSTLALEGAKNLGGQELAELEGNGHIPGAVNIPPVDPFQRTAGSLAKARTIRW